MTMAMTPGVIAPATECVTPVRRNSAPTTTPDRMATTMDSTGISYHINRHCPWPRASSCCRRPPRIERTISCARRRTPGRRGGARDRSLPRAGRAVAARGVRRIGADRVSPRGRRGRSDRARAARAAVRRHRGDGRSDRGHRGARGGAARAARQQRRRGDDGPQQAPDARGAARAGLRRPRFAVFGRRPRRRRRGRAFPVRASSRFCARRAAASCAPTTRRHSPRRGGGCTRSCRRPRCAPSRTRRASHPRRVVRAGRRGGARGHPARRRAARRWRSSTSPIRSTGRSSRRRSTSRRRGMPAARAARRSSAVAARAAARPSGLATARSTPSCGCQRARAGGARGRRALDRRAVRAHAALRRRRCSLEELILRHALGQPIGSLERERRAPA